MGEDNFDLLKDNLSLWELKYCRRPLKN